jgi:SAM-dependent methyltransferase
VAPLQQARASERRRRNASETTPQGGLSTCPVCSSPELEYAFVVDKYPVCQCPGCSLLFLNPQPPAVEPEVVEAPEVSESAKSEARKVLDRLLKYSSRDVRKVLIIHTGAPLLESEASARGLNPVVLETRRAMPVLQSYEENGFDACVLYGSLERVPDPQKMLEAIRLLLKPDGSLLVNTASIDSKPARLLRNRWWEFSSRTYFYFGVNTLQSLLLKSGFGEPLIYADENDPGGILLKVFGGKWMRRYFENRLTIVARPKAMSAAPRLSIIVPVYNERATFSQLIDLVLRKRIEDVDIEIIIVESNSTDGTRDDVLKCREHPRVKVVLEDRPSGKGHAVRAGLQHATGDVILIQDADLEYDINEYEALIWPILSYEQNFVIGSRHKGMEGVWKIRKFSDSAGLSFFFNFGHLLFLTLFNRIYHQKLADPFSMFKVFRRDCLYGLDFECNRFDFDFEIAIKLIRKGYKPIEIPINYQSRSPAEGKKVTMVRDPLTWLRALWKFRSSPLYRGQ